MALGIGGAACLMCTSSRPDLKDAAKIEEGFPINRSIDLINEVFERLKEVDEYGEFYVPRRTRDNNIRMGVTDQPITKRDMCQDFSPLHAYLRHFTFLLNLIYRLISGIHKWGGTGTRNEKWTDEEIAHYKAVRTKFKQDVREYLVMIIDSPKDGSGTSDTGENIKRFFTKKSRDLIMEFCIPDTVSDDQKTSLYNVLQKAGVILRIINCGHKIDTDRFAAYCKEAYVQLVHDFPWVQMSMVAHMVYAHSAERIMKNENYGLKDTSETGLEGLHKILKMVRRDLSRKCSLEQEIHDVAKYMWISSDPIIKESKRRLECSNCLEKNHTRRGCPKLKFNVQQDEDNDIVNTFLLD